MITHVQMELYVSRGGNVSLALWARFGFGGDDRLKAGRYESNGKD
jgi:hypothetical protein